MEAPPSLPIPFLNPAVCFDIDLMSVCPARRPTRQPCRASRAQAGLSIVSRFFFGFTMGLTLQHYSYDERNEPS